MTLIFFPYKAMYNNISIFNLNNTEQIHHLFFCIQDHLNVTIRILLIVLKLAIHILLEELTFIISYCGFRTSPGFCNNEILSKCIIVKMWPTFPSNTATTVCFGMLVRNLLLQTFLPAA